MCIKGCAIWTARKEMAVDIELRVTMKVDIEDEASKPAFEFINRAVASAVLDALKHAEDRGFDCSLKDSTLTCVDVTAIKLPTPPEALSTGIRAVVGDHYDRLKHARADLS